MYQWLNPFGFSAWKDIYDLVDAQSGKQILSNDYRLLKDRNYLILSPKNKKLEPSNYLINANQKEVKKPIKLSFSEVTTLTSTLNNTIFVDANKLKYPLELRQWEVGDTFQPFGMNGKTKKVSKFLKDQKTTLFDKEKIWLLCSDNQVVWVVGLRADDRFKTDESTINILQIRLLL